MKTVAFLSKKSVLTFGEQYKTSPQPSPERRGRTISSPFRGGQRKGFLYSLPLSGGESKRGFPLFSPPLRGGQRRGFHYFFCSLLEKRYCFIKMLSTLEIFLF